jgi:uncharacterized membrane protein (DUF4010 family)
MVLLEVLQAQMPQAFYAAAFLGGLVSSASTVATIALLATSGKVSEFTGALAVSLAILASFTIGNTLALRVAGAKKAVKQLIPYALGATVLYCVLFYAMTTVI